MLSRRHVLQGLSGLGLGLATPGCKRSAPSPQAPLVWPRTRTVEGVEMIELFPHDATETAPLIVAIHGRGDRPDRWVDDWKRFPAKAQIVLPRGFDKTGDGYSWFEFVDGMTDAQFGAAVGAAESRLWNGVLKIAGTRRVIVTGFSQGGILSFAMASRHPDVVSHAFPCSGSCPGPLLPQNKARAAPILAFHGTEDDVLQIRWAREAVHAFVEQGDEAVLKEYPGLGHHMNAAMHEDLWNAIVKALPA